MALKEGIGIFIAYCANERCVCGVCVFSFAFLSSYISYSSDRI